MPALLRDCRSLLLVAYTLLGLGLLLSSGMYTPLALLLVTLAFLAALGAWRASSRDGSNVPPVGLAAASLVTMLLAQLPFANAFYLQSLLYDRGVLACIALATLLVLFGYATKRARWSSWRRRVFLIVLCMGIAIQWLLPWASPAPLVDVFVMLQGAAKGLLYGHDPYTLTFVDIYGGQGISKPITTYTYPPANILLLAPFFAVFGDVRFGMLAANLVTLLLLWRLTRRDDDAWGELLLLLFLFHPRAAFTVEQAWLDPLILGVLSLALLLREEGERAWSAAAYGVFLSMKQYLVFFLPLWWLLERRPKHLLIGLCTGALTMLPFLLWHPGPAVFNGLLFHMSDAFRPDSLTVASLVYAKTGIAAGRSVSLAVGLVFAAATVWTCRRMPMPFGFLLASSVTFFAVFLLGSQAFCNYYMLVSGLLLLAVAAPQARSA